MREWLKNLFKARTPAKCIFRVDAGNRPGLSFGHLSRCITFANLLSQVFNTQNFFVMRDLPDGIAHARQSGCTLFTIPDGVSPEAEAKTLIDLADKIDPDCFVLDLPYTELQTSFFPLFKKKEITTIFIDDFRFYNPGADIVLNSSILAPERFEDSRNGSLFLGPSYFIFDNRLIQDTPLLDKKKLNIIISFGGADPTDLTRKSVQTLLEGKHPDKAAFHIILGPGYVHHEAIQRLLCGREDQFTIIKTPDNIIPFFNAAHLVICAGGRTMYELNTLGKTFIPIASNEIEAEAVRAFIDKGYLIQGLQKWDKKKFKAVLKQILWETGTICERI